MRALIALSITLLSTCNLTAADEILQVGFPRITREWTDSTGQFKVTARLVGMTKTTVNLETESGDVVIVTATKLDQASQAIATEAYSHFLVETVMRDIIQASIDRAFEEKSARNSPTLQRALVAQANTQLRNMTMTLRYRVINVDKHVPPKNGVLYTVNYKAIHSWDVAPDDFKVVGRPAFVAYGRAWTIYQKDLKTVDVNAIIPGQTIFEMTGVPMIAIPGARDFSFRALGSKEGAPVRLSGPFKSALHFQGRKFAPTTPDFWKRHAYN